MPFALPQNNNSAVSPDILEIEIIFREIIGFLILRQEQQLIFYGDFTEMLMVDHTMAKQDGEHIPFINNQTRIIG